jgi:hypothetical protein
LRDLGQAIGNPERLTEILGGSPTRIGSSTSRAART